MRIPGDGFKLRAFSTFASRVKKSLDVAARARAISRPFPCRSVWGSHAPHVDDARTADDPGDDATACRSARSSRSRPSRFRGATIRLDVAAAYSGLYFLRESTDVGALILERRVDGVWQPGVIVNESGPAGAPVIAATAAGGFAAAWYHIRDGVRAFPRRDRYPCRVAIAGEQRRGISQRHASGRGPREWCRDRLG